MKKVRHTITGLILSAILGWIYIPHPIFIFLCSIVGAKIYCGIRKTEYDKQIQRSNEGIAQVFFETLRAAMESGESSMQSVLTAAGEVGKLEGDTPMQRSLRSFSDEVSRGIRQEDALRRMAVKSGIKELESFCEGFLLLQYQGGNLLTLSESYLLLLSEKCKMSRERELCLDAVKKEQYLLLALPPILLFVLKMTRPQQALTAIDMIVRLFCLIPFFGAWRWSYTIVEHLHPDWAEVLE